MDSTTTHNFLAGTKTETYRLRHDGYTEIVTADQVATYFGYQAIAGADVVWTDTALIARVAGELPYAVATPVRPTATPLVRLG